MRGQKSWRQSRERKGAEVAEKPPAGKLKVFFNSPFAENQIG